MYGRGSMTKTNDADEIQDLGAPQSDALEVDFDEAQEDAELTTEQESEPEVIFDRGERADITRLYLHDVECYALLSPEDEQHYARLALKGDAAARERMIVCNLRLVVKIARRYMYRGLELADLIEEGNLGLLRAVEKFDPERGFRFSTYGTWWIRQTIERALMNQGRTVRLPIHIAKELNAYKRAARKIAQNQHHEASAGDIAEVLDVDVGDVQRRLCGNLVEKGVAQKARQHHGIDTAVGKTPYHVENVDLPPVLGSACIAGILFLAKRMLLEKDFRLLLAASRRQRLDELEEDVGCTKCAQSTDNSEMAFDQFTRHNTTSQIFRRHSI